MSELRAKIRHLRSPDSGLVGQLMRFGLVGGTVAIVYLGVTTMLSQVFGVTFQLALAIGFCCGVLLHFTLQRIFVWIHHEEFALRLHHQVGRYLTMAASQYGLTAASTAWLPGALGVSTILVYLPTMVCVTVVGFLLMRFVIFHAEDGDAASAALPAHAGSSQAFPPPPRTS